MATFVRKDIYIEPPAKGASVEEWQKWLKADRREAIKDRREYNKTVAPCERPEVYQETTVRKIHGVWRQSTAIGISGSVEDGNAQVDQAIDPTQELDFERSRFNPPSTPRGGCRINRNKLHRARLREENRKRYCSRKS